MLKMLIKHKSYLYTQLLTKILYKMIILTHACSKSVKRA